MQASTHVYCWKDNFGLKLSHQCVATLYPNHLHIWVYVETNFKKYEPIHFLGKIKIKFTNTTDFEPPSANEKWPLKSWRSHAQTWFDRFLESNGPLARAFIELTLQFFSPEDGVFNFFFWAPYGFRTRYSVFVHLCVIQATTAVQLLNAKAVIVCSIHIVRGSEPRARHCMAMLSGRTSLNFTQLMTKLPLRHSAALFTLLHWSSYRFTARRLFSFPWITVVFHFCSLCQCLPVPACQAWVPILLGNFHLFFSYEDTVVRCSSS
jgi:hypothetical protein